MLAACPMTRTVDVITWRIREPSGNFVAPWGDRVQERRLADLRSAAGCAEPEMAGFAIQLAHRLFFKAAAIFL
jgi:hypothetical protein